MLFIFDKDIDRLLLKFFVILQDFKWLFAIWRDILFGSYQSENAVIVILLILFFDDSIISFIDFLYD